LHRPELRAWALYDWANSAVVTTIIAAIFPIYFYRVAGAGLPEGVATQRFAVGTFVAMVALAILAPVLGALADRKPVKKVFLAFFLCLGSVTTAAMYLIGEGDWLLAITLFVITELSVASTFVFYDALLPHIAATDEVDRVSTTGYALGYFGGGVLLALNLVWIRFPEWFGMAGGNSVTSPEATLPTRLAFLSVAIWWLLFSIPLFVRVREPAIRPTKTRDRPQSTVLRALQQVKVTIKTLRQYRQAGRMLLAFLLYNEGIGMIIKMATIYGAEMGLQSSSMIRSILIVQFVGVPCTVLFGILAGRLGAKKSIFLGLAVYFVIAGLGYGMRTEAHFLVLALLVGIVQGGTQGLSRSLFASLIPKHRSAEFFGLFALSEKLAGALGPALFVATITLTGSSRSAIASIVIFFVVGGVLLYRVDVEQGRQMAEGCEVLADDGARPSTLA
jgi:UMF1 family MFS transporter